MISVCICTYNRSQGLRRTLDSLAGQRGIDLGTVEVLVVDNNCTDDTPTWWKSSGEVCRSVGLGNRSKVSLTLATRQWRTSEVTSFCSLMTTCG